MSVAATLFLLFFGAGLVLALARHPIYGLYAYLLTFYLHPPSAWWRDDVPDIRWSFLAAGVTLVATISRPKNRDLAPWFNTTPARLLIVYVVWMWIQNAWALSPAAHLEMSILFTKYLVLYYLVYTVCCDEKTIAAFTVALVAGSFYFGWLAYGTGASGRLDGVGGPGVNDSNTLGMYLTTGLAIAGFMLLALHDWRRWVMFVSIPLILNGIIMTASRGAFVGLLAAGLDAW